MFAKIGGLSISAVLLGLLASVLAVSASDSLKIASSGRVVALVTNPANMSQLVLVNLDGSGRIITVVPLKDEYRVATAYDAKRGVIVISGGNHDIGDYPIIYTYSLVTKKARTVRSVAAFNSIDVATKSNVYYATVAPFNKPASIYVIDAETLKATLLSNLTVSLYESGHTLNTKEDLLVYKHNGGLREGFFCAISTSNGAIISKVQSDLKVDTMVADPASDSIIGVESGKSYFLAKVNASDLNRDPNVIARMTFNGEAVQSSMFWMRFGQYLPQQRKLYLTGGGIGASNPSSAYVIDATNGKMTTFPEGAGSYYRVSGLFVVPN